MSDKASATEQEDSPLSVTVENGCLVIRIGVETMKYCTENCPRFYRVQKHGVSGPPYVKVYDRNELVLDIMRAMQREEEDGSTPLSDFLDQMTVDAYEDGSLGFHYAKRRSRT